MYANQKKQKVATGKAVAAAPKTRESITKRHEYDSDDEKSMTPASSTSVNFKRYPGKPKERLDAGYLYSPKDVVKHTARAIRKYRQKKATPDSSKPAVASFDGHLFEFTPNKMRKDVGVSKMLRTNSGNYVRKGNPEPYQPLAQNLDKLAKKNNLKPEAVNDAIKKMLEEDGSVSGLPAEVSEKAAEMAAILSADVARSSLAVEKVDETLNDKADFHARFKKKDPTYMGAPVGGSKQLQNYTLEQKKKRKRKSDV